MNSFNQTSHFYWQNLYISYKEYINKWLNICRILSRVLYFSWSVNQMTNTNLSDCFIWIKKHDSLSSWFETNNWSVNLIHLLFLNWHLYLCFLFGVKLPNWYSSLFESIEWFFQKYELTVLFFLLSSICFLIEQIVPIDCSYK